jgi:hypothetical protein
MRTRVRAFASLIPLLLAGCGSAASGSAPIPQPTSTVRGTPAAVTFSLTIPPSQIGSSTRRNPAYVSQATQSMTVAVNGGTPIAIALTPATNPNCTSGSGGSVTCTNLSVAASAGTDTFTFKIFAQTLSGGQEPPGASPLAITTTAPILIVAGQNNSLGTFTLDPVVASIALALASTSLLAGNAVPADAITITAKDAAGATIIGNGSYVDVSGTASPIVISTVKSPAGSPFDSAVSFSTDGGAAVPNATLNGPGDTAAMTYSGLAMTGLSLTARAGSVTSNTVTLSVITSAPSIAVSCSGASDSCSGASAPAHAIAAFAATGETATLTPSEAGWTGAFSQMFTHTSDTCASWASIAPAAGSSATSFTVTAEHTGTASAPAVCSATFTDGIGQSVTVDISITTASFGVN